jgi:hypothetical protein
VRARGVEVVVAPRERARRLERLDPRDRGLTRHEIDERARDVAFGDEAPRVLFAAVRHVELAHEAAPDQITMHRALSCAKEPSVRRRLVPNRDRRERIDRAREIDVAHELAKQRSEHVSVGRGHDA